MRNQRVFPCLKLMPSRKHFNIALNQMTSVYFSFEKGRPRMNSVDLSVMIAGEAGDGIRQAGLLFSRACARGGFYTFSVFDYLSLIRGGHNSHLVRVCDREVYSHRKKVDILLALNLDSIQKHASELSSNSAILYDSDSVRKLPELSSKVTGIPVPLKSMTKEVGAPLITRNSAGLGALFSLLGYDLNLFLGVIEDQFKKRPKIAELNKELAKKGYDYMRENFEGEFPFRLKPIKGRSRYVLTGNDAIALGALKAGMKFFVAYPITPASPILHLLASLQRDAGILVLQAESELAAINMIIGAAYAGVRAMTATSGAGFSLMAEGLGLAGMSETPIVVVLAQRPGPSTGLATYTAQGDLRFVIHASQGEFPRVVVAPGDVEEAYYRVIEAFNLAEKFQVPAIVLLDKHLAESYKTVDSLSEDVKLERGQLFLDKYEGEYKRYLITETGVSPRAVPGIEGIIVKQDGSEHNEWGFATANAENARRMQDKRMRKLEYLRKEISNLNPVKLYGDERAELTIIGWGSTKGAILESLLLLKERGIGARFVQVVYLWPFPDYEVKKAIKDSRKLILVENNKTAQLGSLLKEFLCLEPDKKILKYDGRPFTPEEIVDRIEEAI
ncbi:MAG: hypothetical protein DRO05_07000 [Thermoproteota archaeon]|nr:MAG: hypothetical protein DRO05_07000 [Candidatus Korarchaeota archaeon]